MSVEASASSPFSPPHLSRSSTTPALRPSLAGSIGHQAMPPLMTPGFAPPSRASNSRARSPSPNYFGFQASSNTLPVSTYDGQHARNNWSPPSSAVRSAATYSPTYVPLDQNPDFAAFRRQSEGLGRTFSLSGFHNQQYHAPPSPKTVHQEKSEDTHAVTPAKSTSDAVARSPPIRPNLAMLDPDSANSIRSPKRHLSSDSTNFPPAVRKASPATFSAIDHAALEHNPFAAALSSSPVQIGQPPLFQLPASPPQPQVPRAETVPVFGAATADEILVTPQHVVNLIESNSEQILLLDLRVSTQYAKSRLRGALNLCIPTTLMKRPSFNVQKLAESFPSPHHREKFENWYKSKYIIVYDSSASQMKDAAFCINTIKKFETEGFNGIMYIIKGGFGAFVSSFPAYIDKRPQDGTSTGPGKLTMPDKDAPLPVIGGCPMPAFVTKSAANPFFGNIRQNMDLIGGVGQMELKQPASLTDAISEGLPAWIKRVSEVDDKGARVSDKFLHIEKKEQKRMQDALSGQVSYGDQSGETANGVTIAGIEKGSKNRYNNIWPFEHSRVKLEDVPTDACDYVNASHITSFLSNKRYIATQGPIPTTFSDFWNVVWQQDVRVIIMLTAEQEGGQVKAHNYWSDRRYGPFHLEQLAERKATLDPTKIYRHRARNPSFGGFKSSDLVKPDILRNDSGQESVTSVQVTPTNEEPYIKVRKLALRHDGYPFEPMREITHLQYSSWPDFGAPAHPAHLLGLVEQADAVVRTSNGSRSIDPDAPSRPVVVHCSAGCGRTGTFCTVDTVIDMLKRQRRAQKTSADHTHQPIASSKPVAPTQDTDGFFASSSVHSASSPVNTSSSPVNAASFEQMDITSRLPIDGAWLNTNDLDLVEKTVEDFRKQRISMVQSLRQFVLCYETVLEWLVEDRKRELEA